MLSYVATELMYLKVWSLSLTHILKVTLLRLSSVKLNSALTTNKLF